MGSPHSDAPAPATCGLILLLRAVLHDAATDLARIEREMASAGDDTSVTRLSFAAVAVLDRTGGLLQTQREAILERLAADALDAGAAGDAAGRSLRNVAGRPPLGLVPPL
jgi:hypothetical protein